MALEGWTGWPTEVPSNPEHSVTLWLWHSRIPFTAVSKDTAVSPGSGILQKWRTWGLPTPFHDEDHISVAEWRFIEVRPQNKQSLSQNSVLLGVQSHKPQTHTGGLLAFLTLPPSSTFGTPFTGIIKQISINTQTVLYYSLAVFWWEQKEAKHHSAASFGKSSWADTMVRPTPRSARRVRNSLKPRDRCCPEQWQSQTAVLLCKPNVHPGRQEPAEVSN